MGKIENELTSILLVDNKSFAIYFGLLFLWIYSIGKVLNKNNPELIKPMNIWWIIYLISLIPVALAYRGMTMMSFDQIDSWILAPTGIIGF
ncbi:hypothetical protein GCM10010976_22600 [Bizionia arctica]|uniref:Uncharacterized protein n=1 Tax=Bizionia arctica TaxID=1495645 RepID=A0A917GM66_9FLAO|nr:hypothetical protein GCM10010976_22600 [Bizionia arctica]